MDNVGIKTISPTLDAVVSLQNGQACYLLLDSVVEISGAIRVSTTYGAHLTSPVVKDTMSDDVERGAAASNACEAPAEAARERGEAAERMHVLAPI